MANGLTIAGVFFISLFLSAFFVSYFNMEFNGDNSVVLIDLPMNLEGYNINTNFKSHCDLTDYDLSGVWACDKSGISLSGGGSLRAPLEVHSPDGVYTSEYHIINPSGEYTFIVSDTHFGNYIHVKVKSDGLYIPSVSSLPIVGHWETGIAQFVPIPNAITADTTIKTVYNINSNEVTIVFNGVTYVLDPHKIPDNSFAPVEVVSVQGIISENSLSIESLSKTFIPVVSETQQAIDGLTVTINLGYAMLSLMTYHFPYHILPLTVQIIIVFPQEFMILLGVAMFTRGM